MAFDLKVTGPIPAAPVERPRLARWSTTRLAGWVFGVYLVVAMAVVIFGFGRYHWFLGDDWDFLSDRQIGSLHDLMRPHAEHWSTLPVIAYRLEWRLFGFHYWAYQVATMVMHLTAALLLRVVMRRAGVNPWLATAAAGIFVLFGPGEQNMLWSFQISMVGSLVFGLAHLILAGHDGDRQRRDWLGLAAGLAALLCSGIGPVMVGAAGLAVLLRRGWRLAAFHTVPLTVIFLAWYVAYRDDMPKSAVRPGLRAVTGWLREAVLALFGGLGHFAVLGAALAVLLVVGLAVAVVPLVRARNWSALRRRAPEPLALLVAGLGFVLLTALSRSSFGAGVARSSRYVHVDALFVLPALAVAADAVARRWRVALPLVAGLLLLPIPWNISYFDSERTFFNTRYFRHKRHFVEGIAWSSVAERVPRSQRPMRDILGGEGPSVGWLLDARRDGKIQRPPKAAPELQEEILIRLGVAQSFGDEAATPVGRRCRTYADPLRIDPRAGREFTLLTPVGVRLRGGTKPSLFAQPFTPLAGKDLRIEVDGLSLTFAPLAPAASFRMCE